MFIIPFGAPEARNRGYRIPAAPHSSGFNDLVAHVEQRLHGAAFTLTDTQRHDLVMSIVEDVSVFVLDWQEGHA